MKTKIPEKQKQSTTKLPAVIETYETEIEFTCPVRGLVKQKVKVKKYESVVNQSIADILQSKSVADKLDRKFSGLLLNDDTVEEENGENKDEV